MLCYVMLCYVMVINVPCNVVKFRPIILFFTFIHSSEFATVIVKDSARHTLNVSLHYLVKYLVCFGLTAANGLGFEPPCVYLVYVRLSSR